LGEVTAGPGAAADLGAAAVDCGPAADPGGGVWLGVVAVTLALLVAVGDCETTWPVFDARCECGAIVLNTMIVTAAVIATTPKRRGRR
jgi:hypothetical protein